MKTPQPAIKADPQPPFQTNTHTNYINQKQREEHIKKGICFTCDEKWERGHKCKCLQLFVADESDEEEQPSLDDDQHDHEESQVDSDLMIEIDGIYHSLTDPLDPMQ
uniref:Uncharacterized protein n=1 Tax=Nymphaea colorata TaxID=210225 RepID=A0A5K1FK96_9MAGN